VNLSNDSYFGRSEARVQHLSIARMRAVENRRFLIRATKRRFFGRESTPPGRILQSCPPINSGRARAIPRR